MFGYSGIKKSVLPVMLLIATIVAPLSASAAGMRIYREFKGRLVTNLRGTSASMPPHVKVIRSREGMKHVLDELREIRNYSVYLKINQLERDLKRVNFEKYMLVAVMTDPIDNYSMSISRVTVKNGKLQVYTNYSHSNRTYDIPSKKSLYYNILMLKKSNMPVMLKLNNLSGKKKKEKSVYLTGRLLYWKYSDLQLVPKRIRRKKSVIYYIKGNQVKKFEKYVGRLVTLKAIISRDQDGPYNKDIIVDKVTKVYESH